MENNKYERADFTLSKMAKKRGFNLPVDTVFEKIDVDGVDEESNYKSVQYRSFKDHNGHANRISRPLLNDLNEWMAFERMRALADYLSPTIGKEELHTVQVMENSLILTPNDTKERSQELFDKWMEETYEN